MNKENTEMTKAPAPAKHKHYDLIVKWANDPAQQVWIWQDNQWSEVLSYNITWNPDYPYAIGKEPTEPPAKKYVVSIGYLEYSIEIPLDFNYEQTREKITNFVLSKIEWGCKEVK